VSADDFKPKSCWLPSSQEYNSVDGEEGWLEEWLTWSSRSTLQAEEFGGLADVKQKLSNGRVKALPVYQVAGKEGRVLV
jgi:hypothetical protein